MMRLSLVCLLVVVGLALARPDHGHGKDHGMEHEKEHGHDHGKEHEKEPVKEPVKEHEKEHVHEHHEKEKEEYTTKYDNIDLDEILNNDRLYKKYFDCLANQGDCTPDGKTLKEIVPDALQTECSKCNEKQRAGVEKVFRFLLEKKKPDYQVLEKIYDPEGIYRKRYQAEADRKGIVL